MKTLSEVRSFGGRQLRIEHYSSVLDCPMTFSLYLPPQAGDGPVPLITWLSGLTCTDENFVQKAGAQGIAAQLGLAILTPDTSPRGDGVADDAEGAWDMGLGAGFYVNATQDPWAAHYQMYDYVLEELPDLLGDAFAVDLNRQSISGHSMGGHGALTIALRNPERYHSVSAFAPICSPTRCPWGEKALSLYLGDKPDQWNEHDSCSLIRRATTHLPMLVDQGGADSFLEEQLKTPLLVAAINDAGYPATVRMQEGYDHSYFFIATFLNDHLLFHREYLQA